MAAEVHAPVKHDEFADPDLHRFTVETYHHMIDGGILTEDDRVELLNGVIVAMNPIGAKHAVIVTLTEDALNGLLPKGWHIRVQQPMTLATSEPEPDLAIVQGEARDYFERHPNASDLGLLIEVSDRSLEFERLQKAVIYAAAGIPEYWIINLVDEAIEVYRNPKSGGESNPATYESRQVFSKDDQLTLVLDGITIGELPSAELLP